MIDLATSLASVPGIVALVNLAKQLGLRGPWLPLLAIVLGVALSLAAWAAADAAWWQAACQGVIFGLGAAGLWDLTSPTGDEPRRVSESR